MEPREEQIERYLKGEMTTDEQQTFEEEINNDKELADEVAIHRDLFKGIELQYKQELKKKLQNVDKEEEDEQAGGAKVRRINAGWMAIAAALLVLIAASWFVFLNQQPASDRLYAQYNEVYPNVAHPVTRTSVDEMSDKERAYYHYEKRAFDKASALFGGLLKENTQNTTYLFYKGQSHMHDGAHQKAIPAFRQAIDTGGQNNRFYEAARWYLALCYLKTDDIDQARKLLKAIRQNEGEYAKRAGKILSEL